VDEAGRGPLAGPVVAAAVVLPRETELEGLRDSKCLPPPVREELYERIMGVALGWAAAAVGPEEIDRLNILRATHAAMKMALGALSPAPCGALVDGLPVAGLPCPHRAIVDGDARCVTIAAASIIAKVTRDRLMCSLDERYPGYGFARHKGYTTPEHLRALRELGPSPCHRRSFAPVASLVEREAGRGESARVAAPLPLDPTPAKRWRKEAR
jgi:ribonuclease HII